MVQIAQEEVAAALGTGSRIADVCDLDQSLGVGPMAEQDAARLTTISRRICEVPDPLAQRRFHPDAVGQSHLQVMQSALGG
jgi:hypothetical protein